MSSNISKEVSQILSQMLNNLSNEYPNISMDLTKKNKRELIKNNYTKYSSYGVSYFLKKNFF